MINSYKYLKMYPSLLYFISFYCKSSTFVFSDEALQQYEAWQVFLERDFVNQNSEGNQMLDVLKSNEDINREEKYKSSKDIEGNGDFF